MYYAQFFQRSAIDPEKIIEACGDRGVIILDGRESRNSHHAIAERECNKRGYVGWQLFKGETFTRSRPISECIRSWA